MDCANAEQPFLGLRASTVSVALKSHDSLQLHFPPLRPFPVACPSVSGEVCNGKGRCVSIGEAASGNDGYRLT
jgi:hypothetical protein